MNLEKYHLKIGDKMTLTIEQEENTKYELKENFKKSSLSIEKIAHDLKTTTKYIEELMNLNPNRLEDVWILRNYLINILHEKSLEVIPFTALIGNSENYWFLDSNYINNGIIK